MKALYKNYPLNFESIPSPCYVLEEAKLKKNLQILEEVQQKSQAKILLALKGFAMWRCFPLVSQYLCGITASGLYEAKLGFEEFKDANNPARTYDITVFSPAYKQEEIRELLPLSTHLIFNSFNQWQSYKYLVKEENKKRILGNDIRGEVQVGLRLNPLYSEVVPLIYNPCAIGSRLGITPSEFYKGVEKFGLEGISGLHFHTHCEQNSDALMRTIGHITKHFGEFIPLMRWINFGGGHHITRKDYDIKTLIKILKNFRKKYQVEVFLEPGEAIGWESGFLIGEVVDIVKNEFLVAILDISATAHMPDCLEMPYRPMVRNSKKAKLKHKKHLVGKEKYAYRFGGPSCLSGDVIGDYSFSEPLCVGDRIIFEDMVHYTIVKNNTFNGIPLPSIGCLREDGSFELWREFDYTTTYKNRNS